MLARVAEDLFWMSRNVERAVAVARLIDVTLHLELDDGDPDDDASLWAPLLAPTLLEGPPLGGGASLPSAREVRHHLAFDAKNPHSVMSCIRRARTAARGVRECISSEMWEQLNTLYLSLIDPRVAVEAETNPYAFYKRVREGAQFFQGLADSTLAHDEPWHFICLGKYLERADDVARVLNLQAHLLEGSAEALGGSRAGDETVRWLAVLRSCGAAEGYARYYSLRVEPARIAEFLLLNPVFPQSIRFSLGAAWDALQEIAGSRARRPEGANPAVRALGLLRARLEHAAIDEVSEAGLKGYLQDVQAGIGVVCDHLTRTYLRDEPQPGRLVAVARAAMIMAAQQQQQ